MTVTITEHAEFGRELRRRRRAAGLTLRSLATRVAFDYSYLAQVERGTRAGSAQLARQCDRALGADGRLVRLFLQTAVIRLSRSCD